MNAALSEFTTAQLERELIRRRKAKAREEEPIQFCHHCRHFVPWTLSVEYKKFPAEEPSDNYNACAFKLTQRFYYPEGYDDEYGFYRRNCSRYDPLTEQEEAAIMAKILPPPQQYQPPIELPRTQKS